MTTPRTTPLSKEELERYERDGYLAPLHLLSDDDVASLRTALREHLSGKVRSNRYELTDPISIRRKVTAEGVDEFEYEDDKQSEPRTFGFLFNLWKTDERFARVGQHPIIAGIARQLLGAKHILLMEDNVVVKTPHSKALPWHQDYSYWPLAEPAALTVWIALDRVNAANGAMQIAPGTHKLGERLPVAFGTEQSFMQDARPGIPEVSQNPHAEGYQTLTYDFVPGDCGFHNALVWHGSTPNTDVDIRCAFILRYVAMGTQWLGASRFPYDDIGCEVNEHLTEKHFPLLDPAF